MLWRYVKVVKWGTNFSIILNIETIGVRNLFSVFDYFMATQRFEAMLDEWIILANWDCLSALCLCVRTYHSNSLGSAEGGRRIAK